MCVLEMCVLVNVVVFIGRYFLPKRVTTTAVGNVVTTSFTSIGCSRKTLLRVLNAHTDASVGTVYKNVFLY